MSKKKKLIPELRFPDFKNEGEWETNSIGKVFKSFSGGTPSTSEKAYYGGDIPFIRSAEINKDATELFITDKGLKNSSAKLVNKGDLLVALYGANSGDSAISKINGAINQAILCLQSEYSNAFTYNFLTLKKDWIVSKYIQGGQGNLSGDIVKSISIPFPKKLEQQKIASCLSSLDDLIEAHSQKLELLKDHKKGLMQNLFPQEDEKVPKYRFKEFEKDGNWVEKSLIDTADKKVKWSFTGGPFGSNLKASDYTSEGIRIIQLQNIGDGEFNDEYKIYTSEEKADELLSCNIYAGEIILSKMGDPVGRACIIPNKLKRCVMASDGIRLVVNETKYSKYFVYSLINSKPIREAIENKATGSTRKRIGLDELRNIELIMPKSISEQIKIANCISSLDKSIVAQALKIEQLKEHKKGLMQGLFPKVID
ncbi:restriction endonuclease subunit S [Belliella kenyensis]|uniref:Restriction endonuclease subunit S n=1 Tax=Belliella kenyensis TaxID=1472724 RepID=A0ABV8ELP3_9BACT|nr:restriction endonuclease subunit S [Belliella kenyensis]MCH7403194.1 restriction endonuclease subunit S [Belliella kenyensis]MDN3604805.1 restriction endonuclease subunit S [Belliella kenyensis]